MIYFKNVVLYLLVIIKFVLLRSFGHIIHDIARKYVGLIKVVDLRKSEKLQLKIKKAELDINFLAAKSALDFTLFVS